MNTDREFRHGPLGRIRRVAPVLQGLVVALLIAATPAVGGELIDLQADEEGGVYHIRLEMMLDAEASLLRAVLTDYAHVYRLNPSIVESRLLNPPDREAVRVRTRIESCVAMYCIDLVSVVDVREQPSGDLWAVVIPELSTFRSGSAIWQIRRERGGSRVIYDAQMVPDCFIPPVIGRRVVVEKLVEETMTTFDRLERMAKVRGRREADGRFREARLRGGNRGGAHE